MNTGSKLITPSVIFSLSFTFILNSIKFFEEAREQVVSNQLFSSKHYLVCDIVHYWNVIDGNFYWFTD